MGSTCGIDPAICVLELGNPRSTFFVIRLACRLRTLIGMDALLHALRYRVARSIMPLSAAEYGAFLTSARYMSQEDQERMSTEVLALAFQTKRRWGRRTEPLFDQLIDASDRLLGAMEAA